MDIWETLTPVQLDALQEIGNIGAGNAATALAQMVSQRIEMAVPRAGVVDFREINRLVGDEEDVVACVNFMVEGKAPAHILFLLGEESAYTLVDLLLGQPVGQTTSLDEMGNSALQEVGNILTGSFLNAFSQITGLSFISSPPAFAFDMLGAVLSTALVEGGYYSDKMLVIETQFYNESVRINGHLFLLPEVDALRTILSSLGIYNLPEE